MPYHIIVYFITYIKDIIIYIKYQIWIKSSETILVTYSQKNYTITDLAPGATKKQELFLNLLKPFWWHILKKITQLQI